MCSTNPKFPLSGLCFLTNYLIHLFYVQNADLLNFNLLYFILYCTKNNQTGLKIMAFFKGVLDQAADSSPLLHSPI